MQICDVLVAVAVVVAKAPYCLQTGADTSKDFSKLLFEFGVTDSLPRVFIGRWPSYKQPLLDCYSRSSAFVARRTVSVYCVSGDWKVQGEVWTEHG